MKEPFRLDKRNGLAFGVCSGFANYTGWDVTLVRIGVVLGTWLGAFPWSGVACALAAWLAKPLPTGSGLDVAAARRTREPGTRFDEVDEYIAASEGRLAREFEELR